MGSEMQIDRCIGRGTRTRLSFGELATAELFLLWAVRERLANGPGSERLVEAFRRVFGIAAVEAALAAFERTFAIFAPHVTRDARLIPPSCAKVTSDELLLLHAFVALQSDYISHGHSIAQTFVGQDWSYAFCQSARAFCNYMSECRLALPLRGLATLMPAPAQLH